MADAVLTHDAQTLVLQQALLHRLAPSLWDQGLDTTQAQLFGAVAHEFARWIEEQQVVRQCTLLQEASGIDLDLLLHDFLLKRYNARPDALARQIARQILWTPKATLYALQEIGRLLVDVPQLLGRSGRHQPHWWMAQTAPVVFPRTYWQLGDSAGGVWYLSLADNEVTVSASPPPGANVTPWRDGYTPTPAGGPPCFAQGWEDVEPLDWVRVYDAVDQPWYVRVEPDGGLTLTDVAPLYGRITTRPVQLLDGFGEAWGLGVDAADAGLLILPLTTAAQPQTYWRMRDADNVVRLVFVQHGAVGVRLPPAPAGWTDTTPDNMTLDWFAVPITT